MRLILSLFLIIAFVFHTKSQTNIDFESGSTTGWTLSGSGSITSSGYDSYISSISKVYSGGGNYSFCLGNYASSSPATLTYNNYTVTSSNASFIYYYAVLLNDGGHSTTDQPYFNVYIYDQSNQKISCATYEVNATTSYSIGGFSTSSGGWSYKPWTSVLVPLDAYIGQTITIQFQTRWCVAAVHQGYAYIDCEANPMEIIASSPTTCGGQSVTLTAPVGAQTYSWSGPGGFTASTQVITVTQPGTYDCTLLSKNTSGVNCTSTLSIDITGNPTNPTADFSWTSPCAGTATQFTDQSSISGSSIKSWQWDFGNGNTSTQQNPSNTYTSSGTYTVTLTVTTKEGCSSTTSQSISISKAPSLSFSSTDENCGLKDGTASVTASGGSGSYTYEWATSPKQSTATATGLSSGNYYVTVDDGICIVTGKETVSTKAGPSLTVSSTPEYCGASDGTASVTASGGTSSSYLYSWTTSPVQTTATASNLSSGSYTVTVDDGTCSATAIATVSASASPILTFSTTNEKCGASDGSATVKASGGTGSYTYLWYTSPSQTTKTANSLSAGTYTVAVNDGYCTTIDSVVVSSNDSPIPAVSSTNTTCDKANGTASVSVSGGTGSYTYSWNTSPVQTSSTISGLSPGNYTVTVDDGICPATASVNVIKDPFALVPTADFNFYNVCLNVTTNFTDTSNNNTTTLTDWVWNFGDGSTSSSQSPNHLFNQAGNYSVSLQITNQYGCVDSITQLVTVYPLPQNNFSVSPVCLEQSSIFTDASAISSGSIATWAWDFGDGNSSSLQSPIHLFSQSSSYNVTLLTFSDQGCSDTLIQTTEIYPLPLTNFNSTSVCQGNATSFTDLSSISNGNITNWNWDFGDGNFSTDQSPNYTYSSSGNFNVTLNTISDNGCTTDTTLMAVVNTNPNAGFSFNNVCLYDSALFTNLSTISSGSISNYKWDFGDGNSSSILSPNHKYSMAGSYAVSLIAISGTNCSDTSSQNISIYGLPQAAISTNNVCDEQTASFTDSTNSNGTLITSWLWNFGNGSTSSEQNPNILYSKDGIYYPTLIVGTSDGCYDTANTSIEIYPLPIADYTTNNVCLNEVSSFSNLSYVSSGNLSYQWNFDDGNTSVSTSPTHLYLQDGSYNVELISTTEKGCLDSITQVLTIYPLPLVDFVPDTYNGCVDLEVSFTNNSSISSTAIQSYLWDLGAGTTSMQTNPSNTYTQAGLYTISLTAISDKGCSNTNDSAAVIEAYALPIANFSFAPDYITIMNPKVEFTDLSIDATSWNWTLGDGNSSIASNPVCTYADTGIYLIELWIENQYGCIDSASAQLKINPEFMLYIPNTFTPNKDGINDIFNAKGWGILELNLNILDRWGNLIYSTTDLNKGWDGTLKGNQAQEDVYVYQISAKDVFHKTHNYTGKINLVR